MVRNNLCHSRESGNPVKYIKNKFFIYFFIRYVTYYVNIEVIFLDSRFRGNDIKLHTTSSGKLRSDSKKLT
ncbi:MAG TPA: hypothetical protein LFV92_02175 [Rickettsia endosymbiont of Ceroptres masudai]|nr:hypothetical protein [Rickettsia endosymbiont of Ceroptres masudai]